MRIKGVILAAGFGTRLAPLTDDTPKPLLDVGGRPVASWLVDRLAEVDGLSDIVVVANGRHPARWDEWRRTLSTAPTVTVLDTGATTAASRNGAVADMAAGLAALGDCDSVIVLAGDNLLDEPLGPHVDAAMITGQPVVLCRDLGTHVPPARFGEIVVDEHDRIVRFREKPAVPESSLVAMCSYVLGSQASAEITEYLLAGDADSPGRFIAWLARRRPVLARPIQGSCFDIGNHETLAAARVAFGGSE